MTINRVTITQDLTAMFGADAAASAGIQDIICFSFVPPADVLDSASDIDVLEHLFKVFNIGDKNGPLHSVERDYRRAHMVSMSVGHIVDLEKDGQTVRYRCAPVGWEQVPVGWEQVEA